MEHSRSEPGSPDPQITPDDATPNEAMPETDADRPEPPEPDPDHVVEEKQRDD
jgi:hypothetical protein